MELEHLWIAGRVILDTNALLNLFRYSFETRDAFLAVLSSLESQLWIPHQVGLEFHRRRHDVINQQRLAFDEVEAAIDSATKDIKKTLAKFDRHPSLDVVGLSDSIVNSLADAQTRVRDSKSEYISTVTSRHEHEMTFDAVTRLYEGRVGREYDKSELDDVYRVGRERYENRVPPGFKDAAKPEPDKFGDLVLWLQILDEAAKDKFPAIFVTDDSKEDWWYRVAGETKGPRIELVEEYFKAAGERVHFYTPERFLAYANQSELSSVSDKSLNEVEKVSTAQNSAREMSALLARRAELLQGIAYARDSLDEFEQEESDSQLLNEELLYELNDQDERLTLTLIETEAELDLLAKGAAGASSSNRRERVARLKERHRMVRDEIERLDQKRDALTHTDYESVRSSRRRQIERLTAELDALNRHIQGLA